MFHVEHENPEAQSHSLPNRCPTLTVHRSDQTDAQTLGSHETNTAILPGPPPPPGWA